ncbi:hypothetical protein BH11ACT7_BH11ACT7_06410 [soil metagenome]
MSVKVDLDRLADTLAGFASAYLITVSDDYQARAVAVAPVLRDGVLDVGTVGGGTRRNLAARDGVTLLWPPRESGGYTLIVDGRVLPSSDEAPLQVAPSHAVLHRPAAEAADCPPLDG